MDFSEFEASLSYIVRNCLRKEKKREEKRREEERKGKKKKKKRKKEKRKEKKGKEKKGGVENRRETTDNSCMNNN